jgi:hypothetical protein
MRRRSVDITTSGSASSGLHVHDDFARQGGCDLGEPIGAALMVGRRHARGAAKRSDRLQDAVVIGCDEDGRDGGRRGRTAIDMLDHRTSADVGEGLARQP